MLVWGGGASATACSPQCRRRRAEPKVVVRKERLHSHHVLELDQALWLLANVGGLGVVLSKGVQQGKGVESAGAGPGQQGPVQQVGGPAVAAA